MSIPLIAGPGCLTLTILLFSGKSAPGAAPALILAVLVIYIATFCCLLLSDKIKLLIGRTGDDILRRLLRVILAGPGSTVHQRRHLAVSKLSLPRRGSAIH